MRESRVVLLWVGLIVACVYLLSVYNSFFQTTTAYLYDPASDHIYRLTLMANLDACDKWAPLVPFRECPLTNVVSADDRGTLKEMADDERLARSDVNAWANKIQAELDAHVADIKMGRVVLDYVSISFRELRAEIVVEDLPPALVNGEEFNSESRREILFVDAVVTRQKVALPAGTFDRSEFEVVRNAVLLRGYSARRAASSLTGLQ